MTLGGQIRWGLLGASLALLLVVLAIFGAADANAEIDNPGAVGVANAIARDTDEVTSASFDAQPAASTAGRADTVHPPFPTHGSTYGILATGEAGTADQPNSAGNTGTDLGGMPVRGNTDRDVTIMQVDLTVPPGRNCLSFDFRFLSEEFPEFVGQAFNDAFIAELDDTTWTTSGSTISAPDNFAFDESGAEISVNSSTGVSAENAMGTTYDGATPVLRAVTPVTPGPHTLYLSIFDQQDGIFDSAAFVDDLRSFATSGCTAGADAHPVAVDDQATVNEDSSPNAIDVLANDTDVDGGPRSVAQVTQPQNGTVAITGGGTGLTYEPDPDYCNDPGEGPPDDFTYTLAPGGDTANVAVTVSCVDDDPVAVDDQATVNEDSSPNAIDVLANDTDVDGGPRSVAQVTQPQNGTVAITGGGTGLTYEPDPDYCNDPGEGPPDDFTYTLAPGGDTANVAVTVDCVDDPRPDGSEPPPPPLGEPVVGEPVVGESVNVRTLSGVIRVKCEGDSEFRTLQGEEQIPVGCLIDARDGHVLLTSSKGTVGGTQTGEFWAGIFEVKQNVASRPFTVLKLVGPNANPGAAIAGAGSEAAGRRGRRGKRLWGKSRGKFRSRGKRGAGSVRGTEWLVADIGDSTLCRVKKGKVRFRDFILNRTVILRAGETYVAKRRRR